MLLLQMLLKFVAAGAVAVNAVALGAVALINTAVFDVAVSVSAGRTLVVSAVWCVFLLHVL